MAAGAVLLDGRELTGGELRAAQLLGRLLRARVLAGFVLRVTSRREPEVLRRARRLPGRVVLCCAGLPCLPVLVVGRLLAVRVHALAAQLDGGELTRAVLRLPLLLVRYGLLRGSVRTGPVLRVTTLRGRSELDVARLLTQAAALAGAVVVLAPGVLAGPGLLLVSVPGLGWLLSRAGVRALSALSACWETSYCCAFPCWSAPYWLAPYWLAPYWLALY